jgi:hypothetical protein
MDKQTFAFVGQIAAGRPPDKQLCLKRRFEAV